ncbi:MAG TPA: DNA-processing protein DprA [Kofleriaceae bacterium]
MTTRHLQPEALPKRLQALGWAKDVYARGPLPAAGPAVAIVGARRATQRGMDTAHALSRHLSLRGVQVVSGGALGIDGAAHRGALAANAPTTVVLGSGCDIAYPDRHQKLFETVLASGGTILSELPDGSQPRRGTFLARNKLIAALADVVVVVEAETKSGSLSTAAHAWKLGRVVVAYPGTGGCELLLARGAGIAETETDVDAALAGEPRMRIVASDDDQIVRDAIASGALSVAEIVTRTRLPVRVVLRALARLS